MDLSHTDVFAPLQPTSARLGMLGMIAFLAALTMLFVAGLFGYTYIRINSPQAPPTGTIQVPTLLWLSTVVIMLSSVTIQHALGCVRREKTGQFRLAMILTLLLALLFIAIQTPALAGLLEQHRHLQKSTRPMQLYGMMFFLILIHALHVIGGVIPMTVTAIHALRGRYDHEQHRPVKYVAMYWHFLDMVWLVMFAALLVLS